MKKTEKMLEIEKQFGEDIESLLRRLYYDENKILIQISEELGIHSISIKRWMKKLGIQR